MNGSLRSSDWTTSLLVALAAALPACPMPRPKGPDGAPPDPPPVVKTTGEEPSVSGTQEVIEQDEPTLLATLVYGQGGGVMIDFEFKNNDPQFQMQNASIYVGNYTTGADIPTATNKPAAGTWLCDVTIPPPPGGLPYTFRTTCFASKASGLIDTSNPKVWAFVRVKLKRTANGLNTMWYQNYVTNWNNKIDYEPDPVVGVTSLDKNPVNKEGVLEAAPFGQ